MNINSPGVIRRFLIGALGASLFIPSSFAAFGLTTSGTASAGTYTVDTGAGLVFKVNRATGGIWSINWNGTELNGTTESSLNTGIGTAGTTVTPTVTSSTIKLDVAGGAGAYLGEGLHHYYVVQNGVNNIYMATYVVTEPGNGELRWITRIPSGLFTTFNDPNDLRNSTGNVESDDIFGFADGTTRSKFYGNQQAKDLTIRGISGPGRGVFMAYGNRESSSGGPFFRDIQNQTSEVYNYMNSGHGQTETAYRLGVLHGPYALCFTTGATPPVPPMTFMSTLGLVGYVPSSARGRVVLNGISGRDTTYPYTVGFSNSNAQYWVDAAASNGAATCYDMKPGTYTMTFYKGELVVRTESVTVTAGAATTLNTRTITADPSAAAHIWRIGDWNGSPKEFRNGGNISLMHPSDVRQASWLPGTFPVTGSDTSFPSCMWKGVGSQNVTFALTAAQVVAHTVRIGITTAYSGGRPQIKINSWTSSIPSASVQPDSRTLTIGTYRGNNITYSYSVPASAFVTGTNTMTINVVSGNGGTTYLSPGFAIDCIDMN